MTRKEITEEEKIQNLKLAIKERVSLIKQTVEVLKRRADRGSIYKERYEKDASYHTFVKPEFLLMLKVDAKDVFFVLKTEKGVLYSGDGEVVEENRENYLQSFLKSLDKKMPKMADYLKGEIRSLARKIGGNSIEEVKNDKIDDLLHVVEDFEGRLEMKEFKSRLENAKPPKTFSVIKKPRNQKPLSVPQAIPEEGNSI